MYYIGLDIHKKTISYCVKDTSGRIHQEGKVGATRRELDDWMKTHPQPWTVAMEATIFTGWVHDHVLPHSTAVKVAHPVMLRAIAAAKKKNDRIDASKIADCLRCDFLPECHMATTEIRDRRRTLRYRHLLVRQMVQIQNRISGLLMETGVTHNKQRLHKVKYFRELLSGSDEIRESIRPGTRQVFASAMGMFTLGSLLCGLCTNIHLLVACRVLQGFGGAMMVPVGRLISAGLPVGIEGDCCVMLAV